MTEEQNEINKIISCVISAMCRNTGEAVNFVKQFQSYFNICSVVQLASLKIYDRFKVQDWFRCFFANYFNGRESNNALVMALFMHTVIIFQRESFDGESCASRLQRRSIKLFNSKNKDQPDAKNVARYPLVIGAMKTILQHPDISTAVKTVFNNLPFEREIHPQLILSTASDRAKLVAEVKRLLLSGALIDDQNFDAVNSSLLSSVVCSFDLRQCNPQLILSTASDRAKLVAEVKRLLLSGALIDNCE
jgi:hypothetical protein